MVSLGKAIACMVATIIGLAIFTQYSGGDSVTTLYGWPLFSFKGSGARGIIAAGQVDAMGVIVFAQVGYGIICFAQAGVGLLFGLGQAQAGLACICQAGIGLTFFLGQVGFGAQALGQGVAIGRKEGYFEQMEKEFGELLSFWGKED